MPKPRRKISIPFSKLFLKKRSSSLAHDTIESPIEEITINRKKEKVLAWSPEDIIDGMDGLTIPESMSGSAVLFEVGGIDKGWKIDCTDMESNKIIVTRYDIPPTTSTKPSGPPTNDPSLQSLPWCRYKDRKLFSRIEEGKTSDMVAYMTGKITISGDSSKFDGLDSCWKEAKENAKERKKLAIENEDITQEGEEEEDDDDDEEEDEFGEDEEARIIATYKPEVGPKNPFTEAFWRRHFGTDALVATYLFLLSSIFFLALGIYNLIVFLPSLSSPSVKDLSDFAHKISQILSAFLFVVGSVYFVKLSYPETMMIMAYRAMTIDPKTMSFLERYFTANELLIALWLFALAFVLPYSAVTIYELFFLNAPLLALRDFAIVVLASIVSLYLNVMAMPDAMRMNNGNGSSFFYDSVWAPMCCLKNGEERTAFWKKHLGSDALVGGWIFGFLGVGAGVGVIPLVILEPDSLDNWLLFATSFPFGLGSILFIRASYPDKMNTSICCSGQSSSNNLSTPLISNEV